MAMTLVKAHKGIISCDFLTLDNTLFTNQESNHIMSLVYWMSQFGLRNGNSSDQANFSHFAVLAHGSEASCTWDVITEIRLTLRLTKILQLLRASGQIVLLSLLNVVKQHSVSDLASSVLFEEVWLNLEASVVSLCYTLAILNWFLKEVSSKEVIQLSHVLEMSGVVNWSWVAWLEWHLTESVKSLFHHLELRILFLHFKGFFELIRIDSSLSCCLHLSLSLLLDFCQFDLLSKFLLGVVLISASKSLLHLCHLSLLLAFKSFIHGSDLFLMALEKSIDILLVHVFKDLLLLLS